MLFVRDVSIFVSKNHSGIRKITQSICLRYNVPCVDDVVQDVYKTIVKRDILNKYDPNHPSATKISTYLYNLIKNVVRAYRKSNESVIERHKYHPTNVTSFHRDENFSIDESYIDVEFENILSQNRITDAVDGLTLDLNLFESYLGGRDKFYRLNKRKNMKVRTRGLSLLKVFKLMRKGLSNREIAIKYGVSYMFITVIKNEIKDHLEKFGLYWKETKRHSNKKRFLSDTEVDVYARSVLQSCK